MKNSLQSAGSVEYADCISAEGYDPPNECPVAQSAMAVEYTDYISRKSKIPPTTVTLSATVVEYDTKQFDGEALVLELWERWRTLSLSLLPDPF